MAQVTYAPRANADLAEIWDYIAADNEAAADRVAVRFDVTFGMLAQHPQAGRLRDDVAGNVRTFPVGQYLILYRPIKDGVDIVRVVHGARDLGSLSLE